MFQAEAHRHNGSANGHTNGTHGHSNGNGHTNGHTNGHCHTPLPRVLDAEKLRHWAGVIDEQKAGEQFVSPANHAGLGVASPCQGFAHWRIHQSWVDETARARGNAWHNCALVLRLYDVSFIDFNGLNAHSMTDVTLPSLCGHLFFHVSRPGTSQLGEVGFRLRNGEFIAAARSQAVRFPRDSAAPYPSHAGLLVDRSGRIEEIGNIWDQEQILRERRKPKVRPNLRIAAFAFELPGQGQPSAPAKFAAELAWGQARRGHEVHVFLPADTGVAAGRADDNVTYHPLEIPGDGSPMDRARNFAAAAESRMRELPPFDLLHVHEWMAGMVAQRANLPTVFSLTSVEAVRCNGSAPGGLFLPIRQVERDVARVAGLIMVPDYLHDRAATELDVTADRVHMFPMEARLPDEWAEPLDFGQVKKDIGFGPLDRLVLFVGPLEHAAGVDLLIEAMPTTLNRIGASRVAFAGTGSMQGHLQHRANQLGVSWAVRFLGHVERPFLVKLLRSAESLVLPSRFRVPWDDAVVDLARRAGRPVVTTHSGPGYLVKHEQNGIVTYDNPGSIVWGLDRILQDPGHSEQMGRNGKRSEGASAISWDEVAQRYLDLCAARFEELR
jgi:glycosyltransferase involved in cell wall biosynthesis